MSPVRRTFALPALVLLALVPLLPASMLTATAHATGFQDLESQVQQFTLPNGLTFLVLERHDAPVFSYRTYVNAGGVDELVGTTGVAHMFEHMAFKGTETVGTTDIAAERKALDAVDAAWDALAAERNKGEETDSTRLGELDAAFKQAQEEAGRYVVSNDFSKVLEENGANDLNAFTQMDATQYFYSLPSNRVELWARLEGDRLSHPVLREFYKERSVVQEERRFQESSPMGRAFSTWWMAAFLAHPYGYGLIGYPSDLSQITRSDARRFFQQHYVAKNITVAVVGDVKVDQIRSLAEKYFSDVSTAPKPPDVRTVEPRHDYEIRVTVEDQAQPFVVVGYMIPGVFSPDWPACELLGDMLATGRTSRLYDRLVKKDRIAAQVGGGTGFPGEKYPNMLVVQAICARGAAPDTVEHALFQEIDRFAREGPSASELMKVKTRTRARFIRSLRSNNGLAGELAQYQGMQGDWHKLFGYLDRLDAVTAQDVQRVARDVLRPGNRVVGVLERPVSS
jgi:predicted Zn-dependent peptidase